jgi:hypothetical protein
MIEASDDTLVDRCRIELTEQIIARYPDVVLLPVLGTALATLVAKHAASEQGLDTFVEIFRKHVHARQRDFAKRVN